MSSGNEASAAGSDLVGLIKDNGRLRTKNAQLETRVQVTEKDNEALFKEVIANAMRLSRIRVHMEDEALTGRPHDVAVVGFAGCVASVVYGLVKGYGARVEAMKMFIDFTRDFENMDSDDFTAFF